MTGTLFPIMSNVKTVMGEDDIFLLGILYENLQMKGQIYPLCNNSTSTTMLNT